MQRRSFVAAALATALTPVSLPAFAGGAKTLAYKPGLIKNALANGETVFVDWAADWCSTCARQERVINALRRQNPAYDSAMTFVRVDWDDYRNHEVTKGRNIPRRSTLVLLKGNQELGRLVAETREGAIKGLMDTGLAASA